MPDVVCDCCDLDHDERHCGPNVVAGLTRGWRCRMCNEHQGDPLRKAQEHEAEVRMRWHETVDDWHAAEDRADDYRDKMKHAYRSRDRVLEQFERLSRYHRYTDHGCTCGNRKCETLKIISGDSITDQIARMHKHTS